jgi:hypothetical protein
MKTMLVVASLTSVLAPRTIAPVALTASNPASGPGALAAPSIAASLSLGIAPAPALAPTALDSLRLAAAALEEDPQSLPLDAAFDGLAPGRVHPDVARELADKPLKHEPVLDARELTAPGARERLLRRGFRARRGPDGQVLFVLAGPSRGPLPLRSRQIAAFNPDGEVVLYTRAWPLLHLQLVNAKGRVVLNRRFVMGAGRARATPLTGFIGAEDVEAEAYASVALAPKSLRQARYATLARDGRGWISSGTPELESIAVDFRLEPVEGPSTRNDAPRDDADAVRAEAERQAHRLNAFVYDPDALRLAYDEIVRQLYALGYDARHASEILRAGREY